MKNTKSQITVICLTGALTVPFAQAQTEQDRVFPPPPAAAEIRGANRRVITLRQGYYGVRGRFSVPIIRIPTGNVAAPGVAVPANGFIADGNLANSKPGFYLGVSQNRGSIPDEDDGITNDPIQVDAGIIYESHSIRLGAGPRAPIINPGWSPFVRTTSKYTVGGSNGFAGAGNRWRAGFGTANPDVTDFDLAWTIFEQTRGGVRVGNKGGMLYVYAKGAITQPVDAITGEQNFIYARDAANGIHICDTTIAMGVKRVVAMNQGGGFDNDNDGLNPQSSYLTFPGNPGSYEEDGSYMRGCTFGGLKYPDLLASSPSGQVVGGRVPIESEARNFLSYVTASGWGDFGSALIDLTPGFDSTGRYPGGNDQTLRPAAGGIRHLPTSRPIIEFPAIALADYNTPTPERYSRETVNINLRRAVQVAGRRYTVGGVSVTNE